MGVYPAPKRPDDAPEVTHFMWWLLLITAAVFGYLCYVLVRPEKF